MLSKDALVELERLAVAARMDVLELGESRRLVKTANTANGYSLVSNLASRRDVVADFPAFMQAIREVRRLRTPELYVEKLGQEALLDDVDIGFPADTPGGAEILVGVRNLVLRLASHDRTETVTLPLVSGHCWETLKMLARRPGMMFDQDRALVIAEYGLGCPQLVEPLRTLQVRMEASTRRTFTSSGEESLGKEVEMQLGPGVQFPEELLLKGCLWLGVYGLPLPIVAGGPEVAVRFQVRVDSSGFGIAFWVEPADLMAAAASMQHKLAEWIAANMAPPEGLDCVVKTCSDDPELSEPDTSPLRKAMFGSA